MYKFYAVIALIFTFAFLPQGEYLDTLGAEFYDSEYFFYISGSCDTGGEVRAVKNGDQDIIICPTSLAKEVRARINGKILGESFRCRGSTRTAQNIKNKLGAKLVKSAYVDGIYILYLYSGQVRADPICMYGDRVNLQIAVSKNTVTVGSPIILGGY